MAIISTIGRRHWTVRLLIGSIYTALTLGAVSMLYPFGLMIAGSTKSNVDTPDPELIPRYLVDRGVLWRKYCEALMNESFELARLTFRTDALTFRDLPEPQAPNLALAALWKEFCSTQEWPFYAYTIGHVQAARSRGVLPSGLRAFKGLLVSRFEGDITRVNRELGAEFGGWNEVFLTPALSLNRRDHPGLSGLDSLFRDFKAKRPLHERVFFSLEGYYRYIFLQGRYGREIKGYNEAHGTAYADWSRVHLPRRLSDAPQATGKERQDWEEFMRTIANLYWIRVDVTAAPAYREYLRAKHGTLQILNRNYHTTYTAWEEIPLVEEPPMSGMVQSDWAAWVEGWVSPDTHQRQAAPLEALYVQSVDFMFRDWLQKRFGSLDALNADLALRSRVSGSQPPAAARPPVFGTWLDILPPQEDWQYESFLSRTGALRKEFTSRNFVTVVDYMVLHGRGILNTLIYCSLAILASLLVNPLAAYALSRFKPPSRYKVLLFLMLTMSFPQMVTQIPLFLMLREFNLLNTFAALVLPGLANGYSIFLLKGFFDSLPKELYESAEIDGASEFRVFWQITMSLSKPILAVTALGAFNHAYSNFMMALLICQDERMWTLMPWLYQLQSRSGEGVIFASLLIASVPTLLVFAFCQNIIMRGIVVPVEK